MNYVWGSAKLSSSTGDKGTLVMVSFRPSVEPIPMDANDRTDIASDQVGCGNMSCVECRLVAPVMVAAMPCVGDVFSDRRLGDRARDAANMGGRRYESSRHIGRSRLPSLLLLPLLLAVAVAFFCRCCGSSSDASGSPATSVSEIRFMITTLLERVHAF